MRTSLLVIVMLVLLAAACGGDDGELESADGSGDTTATATDQDQGDGSDGGGSDDSGSGDGEASGGDAGSDWCDAVRSAADEEDSPLDLDLLGLTPEELEARFNENIAVLEDWEAKAPPEIESQVTTLVDAFRTMVSMADEAEWDLFALGTDPEFQATFDNPELEMVADDIDRYSRDVCGVDLGAAGDGADVGTAPSVPSAGGGDAATEFLETFGLPANFLDEAQLACVTGELENAYPDGIPDDLALSAETIELFDTVGAACGIGTP